MIVVLQIVINNGFYCRKSHQNSPLSAISRRDLKTWTLIVLGIGLPLSKFTQTSPHNSYSNREQYTAASAHNHCGHCVKKVVTDMIMLHNGWESDMDF
jgi:hypothetical protein